MRQKAGAGRDGRGRRGRDQESGDPPRPYPEPTPADACTDRLRGWNVRSACISAFGTKLTERGAYGPPFRATDSRAKSAVSAHGEGAYRELTVLTQVEAAANKLSTGYPASMNDFIPLAVRCRDPRGASADALVDPRRTDPLVEGSGRDERMKMLDRVLFSRFRPSLLAGAVGRHYFLMTDQPRRGGGASGNKIIKTAHRDTRAGARALSELPERQASFSYPLHLKL